jgi:hypothetical protein
MGCICWWVVGTKKGSGAKSTARNGGGRGGASMFPVTGGVGSGEEAASEHQELKAHLLEVLGRGRDNRRWGSHGGPKRRRRE